MPGTITHHIDTDKKLITRRFKGTISVPINLESWNKLMRDTDLSVMKGVINDISDANLNISPDELKQIISFLKLNGKIFSKVKIAVVSSKPSVIVLPVLASHDNPQFQIKAFSTIEGAESWILSKF